MGTLSHLRALGRLFLLRRRSRRRPAFRSSPLRPHPDSGRTKPRPRPSIAERREAALKTRQATAIQQTDLARLFQDGDHWGYLDLRQPVAQPAASRPNRHSQTNPPSLLVAQALVACRVETLLDAKRTLTLPPVLHHVQLDSGYRTRRETAILPQPAKRLRAAGIHRAGPGSRRSADPPAQSRRPARPLRASHRSRSLTSTARPILHVGHVQPHFAARPARRNIETRRGRPRTATPCVPLCLLNNRAIDPAGIR